MVEVLSEPSLTVEELAHLCETGLERQGIPEAIVAIARQHRVDALGVRARAQALSAEYDARFGAGADVGEHEG